MIRHTILAALLILAGCGGGSHHHAPPVDHAFDPVAGSWQATCTARSGDYAGIPIGTVGHFTVDHLGHLAGWDAGGGTISVTLTPNGATGYVGTRLLSNGKTEQVFLWLTAPPIGTMNDGAGSATWALVLLAAAG